MKNRYFGVWSFGISEKNILGYFWDIFGMLIFVWGLFQLLVYALQLVSFEAKVQNA